MKLDVHGSVIACCMRSNFYHALEAQLPDLLTRATSRKIKKVQIYSDYFEKDGSYPFLDAEYAYYPLTIIFYNETYEMRWIKWKLSDIDMQLPACFPFAFLDNHPNQFQLCDSVSSEFERMIAGKHLCWDYGTKMLTSYAQCDFEPDCPNPRGYFNQCFIDVLAYQMGTILAQLAEKQIPSSWDIRFSNRESTVIKDGISYRRVWLANTFPECITVGICWKEPYDFCDYVSENDIQFAVTEVCPNGKVTSIKDIVAFIQRGGGLTKADSIPKSHKRNMSFACDISENIGYPDVCFTFCFYEAIDGNDEKRINDALERFVTKYNSGHANKIHDFFRLDEPIDIPDELPPERVIQFAVDFGNCNPKVIERLINYLQRIDLGIEKLILL